jgi:ABC-type sugar transport system permease subunit
MTVVVVALVLFSLLLLLGNLFSVHGSFISFQNVQQIAVQMKNYSEILQDIAKDMDNVSKSMASFQEHFRNTRNDK